MTSFLSLAQRAILAHAKWCRKSYGLGLISPSRLSPAASHIFLKLNGIDDADMILPLGPGKKYSRLGNNSLWHNHILSGKISTHPIKIADGLDVLLIVGYPDNRH